MQRRPDVSDGHFCLYVVSRSFLICNELRFYYYHIKLKEKILTLQFKQKPIYQDFKKHRESIEQSIKKGRPADDVIEQLERDWKVTEIVKQAILAMENN